MIAYKANITFSPSPKTEVPIANPKFKTPKYTWYGIRHSLY